MGHRNLLATSFNTIVSTFVTILILQLIQFFNATFFDLWDTPLERLWNGNFKFDKYCWNYWLISYDVIKSNVTQSGSYRPKLLKCYKKWLFYYFTKFHVIQIKSFWDISSRSLEIFQNFEGQNQPGCCVPARDEPWSLLRKGNRCPGTRLWQNKLEHNLLKKVYKVWVTITLIARLRNHTPKATMT